MNHSGLILLPPAHGAALPAGEALQGTQAGLRGAREARIAGRGWRQKASSWGSKAQPCVRRNNLPCERRESRTAEPAKEV